MDWKEFSVSKETEKPRTERSGVNGFLRPTKGKVVFFIILMGGLNYLWISGMRVMDAIVLIGLPLGFWPVGSGFYIADTPGTIIPQTPTFSIVYFVIDIVFWYIVSCIIVFSYNKIRKARTL